VEESKEVCRPPIRDSSLISLHFDIFEEFKNASYAQRYEILCRKLVGEGLYDAATLLLSPREAGLSGIRIFTNCD